MKKIYLYALLCLSFTQLKAQDGVVFKIKYLPNHNYQSAINLGVKLNLTITGDPQIIEGVLNTLPAEVRGGMWDQAHQAYAAHAERIHGTATPRSSKV